MVSVAGCGSMFYEGWGPCPVLPVAPPGGSARLAAGRGTLEQLRNYLLGGGREGPGGSLRRLGHPRILRI